MKLKQGRLDEARIDYEEVVSTFCFFMCSIAFLPFAYFCLFSVVYLMMERLLVNLQFAIFVTG